MAYRTVNPAMQGPRTGRKLQLAVRPEIQEEICENLEKGMYFESACYRAGVSSRAANDWLLKGRRDIAAGVESVFERFWYAVKKAEADFEARMHDKMEAAGNDPRAWDANAWRLERRMPDKYSRTDRTQLTVSGQMAVGVATLSDSLADSLDSEEKIASAKAIGQILSTLGAIGWTDSAGDDRHGWEDDEPAALALLELDSD